MASDLSPGRVNDSPDFAFAFNDKNFSDRVLRIEIVADFFAAKIEDDDDDDIDEFDEMGGNRKRRREDTKNENEDGEMGANQEKDVAMVEKLPSCNSLVSAQPGDESIQGKDARWNREGPTVLRVNSIHISSPILAAKSPFFYRLFSEGMRDPEQRQVTLRIQAYEEAALMELLNYMYSNTLSTTVPSALLNILMTAEKYEVASCMRYCSRLLRDVAMTCESDLCYLDLPGVLTTDENESLIEEATHFFALQYKDISKSIEKVLELPLAGIEAVLSSDDLQVASEDVVYGLVLKWARIHYPKLEERREILGQRLSRFIRFPYMTCRKLKKALTCSDFNAEMVSKLVLEALFFKAETPYRQRVLAAEEDNVTSYHRFVERAYKYRPVKEGAIHVDNLFATAPEAEKPDLTDLMKQLTLLLSHAVTLSAANSQDGPLAVAPEAVAPEAGKPDLTDLMKQLTQSLSRAFTLSAPNSHGGPLAVAHNDNVFTFSATSSFTSAAPKAGIPDFTYAIKKFKSSPPSRRSATSSTLTVPNARLQDFDEKFTNLMEQFTGSSETSFSAPTAPADEGFFKVNDNISTLAAASRTFFPAACLPLTNEGFFKVNVNSRLEATPSPRTDKDTNDDKICRRCIYDDFDTLCQSPEFIVPPHIKEFCDFALEKYNNENGTSYRYLCPIVADEDVKAHETSHLFIFTASVSDYYHSDTFTARIKSFGFSEGSTSYVKELQGISCRPNPLFS